MITNNLSTQFTRAKEVYQKEGFITLIKRTFAFLLSWFSYENCTYNVYEHVLQKRDEADFMPKIKNFTLKVIETTRQLDELINNGFDVSLLDVYGAHYRLKKKAIVNLLFIGNELAYRGWWAMTEEAKNTFNRYPYKVDFSNGEVCIGDGWANPKYRNQGISTYVDCKLDEILIDRGIRKKKLIALTSNIAAQRTLRRIGGYNLYAEARYLRIGRIQFWKETPVKLPDNN